MSIKCYNNKNKKKNKKNNNKIVVRLDLVEGTTTSRNKIIIKIKKCGSA
jgi:hypothetical protein